MKRVTKRDRQLYDLLLLLSGLLDDPESYGMRSYYAMPGTIARQELIKKVDAALQPYLEMLRAESEAEETIHNEGNGTYPY